MAEKKQIKGAKSRNRPGISMEIPINLEKVLLRAAVERPFHEALLEDPDKVLAGEGLALTGSERAMLAAMDRSTLETMIDRFVPGKKRCGRFARHVAAAVAGSMIITVSPGCTEEAGGRPDDARADDGFVDTRHDVVGGIWPDWPPDAPPDLEPDIDDMVESDLAEDDVTAGDVGDDDAGDLDATDAEETDG